MGLASDMKNLSENLLISFRQRISENEELVNDVQKTLDGFRKDHQEMADILNANAAALRKGLARGEKDRLNTFTGLMNGIHRTIGSIQKEVLAIQTSTFNMINEFATDRAQMADDLKKTFKKNQSDRNQNEKNRMKEFDSLMKNINDDITSINDEVATIFKNTNDMIDRFEKEHLEMSAELKAELGKNLSDRVEYTRTLLNGFQKKLADISKENQKMAQKLRKDLANGEANRLSDYNSIMKGINAAIKGIRKEVKDIHNATFDMLGDLSQNRVQANATWNKMQATMAQIRKTGNVSVPVKKAVSVSAPVENVKKVEKKEVKKEEPVEAVKEIKIKAKAKEEPKPVIATLTLEEKVLDYINRHPNGVKISEMEEPLGEVRMKLGFVAKNLFDEGKLQKRDNIYFPTKIN